MREKACEYNRSTCSVGTYSYVGGDTTKSASDFMGYLKGKSTMIIFERYSNLKYKYGNRQLSDEIDALSPRREAVKKCKDIELPEQQS